MGREFAKLSLNRIKYIANLSLPVVLRPFKNNLFKRNVHNALPQDKPPIFSALLEITYTSNLIQQRNVENYPRPYILRSHDTS
jgi:hypothetical protein